MTTKTINSTASDLFFNWDNSKYWLILPNNEYEALVTLRENAQEFCNLMGAYNVELEAEDVVEDFLSRV